MDDPVLNFTWIYFIGMTKLKFSFKETGRLTLKSFLKYYQCYKDTFDLEMLMKASNTTYKKIKEQQELSDKWF